MDNHDDRVCRADGDKCSDIYANQNADPDQNADPNPYADATADDDTVSNPYTNADEDAAGNKYAATGKHGPADCGADPDQNTYRCGSVRKKLCYG